MEWTPRRPGTPTSSSSRRIPCDPLPAPAQGGEPRSRDDFPVKSPENPEEPAAAVPGQVESCTGVGYYFARRLHRVLKVPVGLVDAFGRHQAQHWCSKKTLRGIKKWSPISRNSRPPEGGEGGGKEGADKRSVRFKAYREARAKWEEKGKDGPRGGPMQTLIGSRPKGPTRGHVQRDDPPHRQALRTRSPFYQGENNSFTVGWKPFHRTFPSVISDWRRAFGEENLPWASFRSRAGATAGMTYDMNHHCNGSAKSSTPSGKALPARALSQPTTQTRTAASTHAQDARQNAGPLGPKRDL